MDVLTAPDRHLFCLQPLHPGPCEGWKAAKAAGLDHTIAHPELAPKRRRKAAAKPAPKKPRQPRESKKTVDARIRQGLIDDSRSAAEVIGELEERAILNEERDPNVLQRALMQIAARNKIEQDESIEQLIDTAGWGDTRDLVHAMRAAAARFGLERIGGIEGRPLQKVSFNPKEHEAIDGRPRVGQKVQVVRPGFYGVVNGERVLLVKAKVEATDPDAPRSAVGADVDWEARLASGILRSHQISNSDNYSKVELVTFGDGSRAIRKTGKTWPGTNWPATMVQEHDAEELGALVAQELGLKPPGVYRATPDEAYFDYIEDDKAELGLEVVGWGKPVPAQLTESLDGRRMGLLDVLIENRDRNDGNWFKSSDPDTEEEIIPIDHGVAFSGSNKGPEDVETGSNEFARPYVNGERGQWIDNDLSPGYLASLRDGLAGLKPQFNRLGRGSWHGRMMQRLAILQRHARGERIL